MDPEERRIRQAQMRLEQLRHQVGLRHSDLQRRFVLALTIAAGLFVSFLRAEVPLAGLAAAAPFIAWAGLEVWRIGVLAASSRDAAHVIIRSLDPPAPPKDSRSLEGDVP